MFYKHNYKKEEKEKGKGKGKVIFQKIKEKIKDMDRYDLILIIIPFLLLYLLYPYARTNKKAVDVKPQTLIQSQEEYINPTAKLNEANFEVFISKKNSNAGMILIKSSDFIKNNSNIILYKAVKNVIISGSPEIIEKLKFNITNHSNVNLKKNTIQIELDSNRRNNSVLSLNLNLELLNKDEIINNETLLTVEYVETYVD